MNIQEFVVNFANQFDDTELDVFSPETSFRDLEEWSSLVGLAVMNMIAKKYDVKITPAEIVEFEIVKPMDEDDKKVDLVATDDNFNFYILRGDIINVVNKDFTFKPYTELTDGTKVYATYQNTDDGPYICGLYSYKPR
jgi:hypothetical protein